MIVYYELDGNLFRIRLKDLTFGLASDDTSVQDPASGLLLDMKKDGSNILFYSSRPLQIVHGSNSSLFNCHFVLLDIRTSSDSVSLFSLPLASCLTIRRSLEIAPESN